MNQNKYKIGDFVVDVGGHRMHDGNQVKNIEPRVLAALHFFLEHPGEVITREALIKEVWSDIIVTDHAVTQCIGNIRKLFRDRATDPRYIETIPKRGYRFIAEVEKVEPQAQVPVETEVRGSLVKSDAPVSTEVVSEKKLPINIPWAIAVIVLATLIFKDFLFPASITKGSKEQEPQYIPATMFTSLPGTETYPKLSPDGRFIAYIWEDHSRPSDLFIQSTEDNSLPRRQLTFTDAKELFPSWSPNGYELAFIRLNSTEDCQVLIINVNSLKERYVDSCDIDQFDGLHLSWSPDGTEIAFANFEDGQNKRGMVIKNLITGARRRLPCHFSCEYFDFDASWSRDGKYIVVNRKTSMMNEELFLYEANGETTEKQLTSDGGQIVGHTWLKDNKHLIVASNRWGNPRLFKLNIDTLVMDYLQFDILDDLNNFMFPDMQGDMLAFATQDQEFFISKVDLPKLSDTSIPKIAPNTFIKPSDRAFDPTYSKEHKQVAYVSGQTGAYELWSANIKDPRFHQLTKLNKAVASPKWSPNGKYIAFVVADYETEQSSLYLLEVETGHYYPIKTELSDFLVPEWTPDSEYLLVGARSESETRLWKLPIDGKNPELISDGGIYGKMGPDGKHLYFVKDGEGGLYRQDVRQQQSKLLIPELAEHNWSNWDISSEGIYYLTSNTSVDMINFYDFKTEEIRPLARLPKLTVAKFGMGLFEIVEETHSLIFVQNNLLIGDIYLANLNPDQQSE